MLLPDFSRLCWLAIVSCWRDCRVSLCHCHCAYWLFGIHSHVGWYLTWPTCSPMHNYIVLVHPKWNNSWHAWICSPVWKTIIHCRVYKIPMLWWQTIHAKGILCLCCCCPDWTQTSKQSSRLHSTWLSTLSTPLDGMISDTFDRAGNWGYYPCYPTRYNAEASLGDNV